MLPFLFMTQHDLVGVIVINKSDHIRKTKAINLLNIVKLVKIK